MVVVDLMIKLWRKLMQYIKERHRINHSQWIAGEQIDRRIKMGK